MTQLILSVALMYLVVGSAGYWGMRRRRALEASQPNENPSENSNESPNESLT